jgi:hypothetical protein
LTVVLGATAFGVLLVSAALVLVRARRPRPAPALAAPLPAMSKRPPPEPAGSPVASTSATARRSPLRDVAPLDAETCWVVCWRGAQRAAFYAIARDPAGHQHVVDESPAFAQPRAAPLVLDGASLEAFKTLADQLAHAGWEAASPAGARGAEWRACEFRRRAVPAERRARPWGRP